eukprot:TRINITY_DN6349_c0_g2_i2.p1 TRINITY_DN6349_c0_g2~~TRINITY_DN6349_c0_g2_i2.p1  ORF type:complete len:284 (+),score=24.17 TRINITY_DN6349_c0_g2_i2:84-854(+)
MAENSNEQKAKEPPALTEILIAGAKDLEIAELKDIAGLEKQLKAVESQQAPQGFTRRELWCGASLLLMSLALIAMGLTFLILAVTFHTEDPYIRLENLNFEKMSIRRKSHPPAQFGAPPTFTLNLNASIDAHANLYNPNGHEIIVDGMVVRVLSDGRPMANLTTDGFSIPPHTNYTAHLPISIAEFPLVTLGEHESILAIADKTKNLAFTVVTNAIGRVKLWGFKTAPYNVQYKCSMTYTSGAVVSNGCQKKRWKV